jgi:hypothetical protein
MQPQLTPQLVDIDVAALEPPLLVSAKARPPMQHPVVLEQEQVSRLQLESDLVLSVVAQTPKGLPSL